jgi:hypothetical protein
MLEISLRCLREHVLHSCHYFARSMQERYIPSQDAIDTAQGIEQRFDWTLSPRGTVELDLDQQLFPEEAASPAARVAADAFVVSLVDSTAPGSPPLSPGEVRVIFDAYTMKQAASQRPSVTLLETWGATQRRIRWVRESNRALDSRVWVHKLERYQELSHAIEDALPPELRPLPF